MSWTARGELQHVGEPRVLKFRIDGTHLAQESAALAGLLAKVEVGVPPRTHACR